MQISEEINAAAVDCLLDKLTLLLILPECRHEGSGGIALVVLAHDLLDMDRGLASVVKRNGRDQVMANVGANNVVEEMGINETEITIDCRSRSTRKCPLVVAVMWERSIGVL